jgi:phosphatidylglycerophosphatase A
LKTWPANLIDRRMSNPWGVMLDDGVAALQAAIVMRLLALAL